MSGHEFRIKELIVEELIAGTLTRTRIAILYIDGLTNIENVNTIRQRVRKIDIDQITDSHFIEEKIADNHNSPFPQLISTENPAKVASDLTEGKVVILVNGSPFALLGPTTIISFFVSYEDYLNNWILATSIRILRLVGISFSILATPLYVAILTYHPEIVPKDLMAPLVSSRETVPFPPILEALLLELSIETASGGRSAPSHKSWSNDWYRWWYCTWNRSGRCGTNKQCFVDFRRSWGIGSIYNTCL